MIEIISGLPDNVVGIVVKGRLTKKDFSEVLVPKLDKALEWHHKLRLYYEIRSRFPGAAWEEIGLGLERMPQWERVAIVTDVAWIRHTVQALRLVVPGEIRVFETAQTPEALAWISGTPMRKRELAPLRAAGAFAGEGRAFRPPVQYLRQAL